MKERANIELETISIKKTLAMEVREPRKDITDLKVKLMSSKAIRNRMEDRLGEQKEQKYV